MVYKKGTVFTENGKRGYTLTRDCYPGDQIRARDFEPFGGAEPITPGDSTMPEYLVRQLYELQKGGSNRAGT